MFQDSSRLVFHPQGRSSDGSLCLSIKTDPNNGASLSLEAMVVQDIQWLRATADKLEQGLIQYTHDKDQTFQQDLIENVQSVHAESICRVPIITDAQQAQAFWLRDETQYELSPNLIGTLDTHRVLAAQQVLSVSELREKMNEEKDTARAVADQSSDAIRESEAAIAKSHGKMEKAAKVVVTRDVMKAKVENVTNNYLTLMKERSEQMRVSRFAQEMKHENEQLIAAIGREERALRDLSRVKSELVRWKKSLGARSFECSAFRRALKAFEEKWERWSKEDFILWVQFVANGKFAHSCEVMLTKAPEIPGFSGKSLAKFDHGDLLQWGFENVAERHEFMQEVRKLTANLIERMAGNIGRAIGVEVL